MSELVFHVGLMKSGTTYLQEVLSQNRSCLNERGWDYPGARLNQQHACYSLCGTDIVWLRKPYPESLGNDLVARVRGSTRNVMISSEALSVLPKEAIERFIDRVGSPDRVVFTIRGLGMTLPSAWQQYLKGGGRTTLGQFIQRLALQRSDMSGFWSTYGFGHSVARWSEFAKVVVVVSPRNGANPSDLWDLFRIATGLPQVDNIVVSPENSNPSLGIFAAHLLRYLNNVLPKHNARSDAIRRGYLNRVLPLVEEVVTAKISLPKRYAELVKTWNDEEIGLLETHADELVGDPDDLHLSEMRDARA